MGASRAQEERRTKALEDIAASQRRLADVFERALEMFGPIKVTWGGSPAEPMKTPPDVFTHETPTFIPPPFPRVYNEPPEEQPWPPPGRGIG